MFLGNFTAFFLQTLLMFAPEEDTSNRIHKEEIVTAEPQVTPMRCYDYFGCFSLDAPFVTEDRQLDVFPLSPKILNVSLCMYTKEDMNECKVFSYDPQKNQQVFLDSDSKVKVISHGYLEHGREEWIGRLKNKILEVMNDTVVMVVDWEGGSAPPYTQAVSNARLVGAIVAKHLQTLHNQFNIDTGNIHFIGHSLGAHIAGYTGTELKKENLLLGRITGMDPAGPHFEATDPLVKLDYTDAKFVDIIHTDASLIIGGGLGIVEANGHVDFYPNGGVDQPGCTKEQLTDTIEKQSSVLEGIKHFFGCDHLRVIDYFTNSIDRQCEFIGHRCSDWQSYLKGECASCTQDSSNCAYMGMYADTYNIANTHGSGLKMYLKTTNEPPFCSHQYVLTITISSDEANGTHPTDNGFMYATLFGNDGKRRQEIKINPEETEFAPGSQYTWALASEIAPPLSALKLRFKAGSSMLNPLTWGLIINRHVHINQINIRSIRDEYRVTMCGNNRLLTSGSAIKLYPSDDCPENNGVHH